MFSLVVAAVSLDRLRMTHLLKSELESSWTAATSPLESSVVFVLCIWWSELSGALHGKRNVNKPFSTLT